MRLPKLKSLWMIVAGFLFAVMGVFVKLGSSRFSSAELVFYRSLFGFAVILGIILHQRLPLSTADWKMHFWRGLSGFIALMLFFHCLTVLPLATAITLNYTAPLFLALLTTLVLKERPGLRLILAVFIGFGGAILLLKPTFDSAQLNAGIIGLLSGFLAGVAYLNVKQLGMRGEPEWRTVFYFTLFSTIGAGCWMLLKTFHVLTLGDLPLLFGLGASATLAQLAMTKAYREGATLIVGSLAYSTIVFSSLWGYLLWEERLNWLSWLAIALIISAGVLSLVRPLRIPSS